MLVSFVLSAAVSIVGQEFEGEDLLSCQSTYDGKSFFIVLLVDDGFGGLNSNVSFVRTDRVRGTYSTVYCVLVDGFDIEPRGKSSLVGFAGQKLSTYKALGV